VYLAVTLTAAVRTEESALDEKFRGAYSDYREGRSEALPRAFSWDRARANGEHRAVAGLAAVFVLLVLRIGT
jgi:hypothetical protein